MTEHDLAKEIALLEKRLRASGIRPTTLEQVQLLEPEIRLWALRSAVMLLGPRAEDYDCSLRKRTVTREEWDARHLAHGEPRKDYLKVQPPAGYKLYDLICPCGARITETEPVTRPDLAEAEASTATARMIVLISIGAFILGAACGFWLGAIFS